MKLYQIAYLNDIFGKDKSADFQEFWYCLTQKFPNRDLMHLFQISIIF